ncbi:MAG: autotransporter domain-containing protein [Pseudomonadota bacterium]
MKNFIAARRIGAAVGAIAMSALALSDAIAQDATVGRLFVLGDSLSDGGTYTNFADGALGNPGLPTRYRFTNNRSDGTALVWAEYFAALNGVPLEPNIITPGPAGDGTNFAQGASRVSEPNAGAPPNLITATPVFSNVVADSQVARLIALTGGQFRENDIVTIWAGGNDALAAAVNPTQAQTILTTAATQLAEGVRQLEALGAKNIIVFTQPDAGRSPNAIQAEQTFPGSIAAGSLGARLFNSTLIAGLNGSDAVVFDVGKLFDAVVANPASFGIDVGLTPQAAAPNPLTGIACENAPNQSSLLCVDQPGNAGTTFLFADSVHPTTEAHALVAAALQGLFAGAEQQARLLETTLANQRQAELWREERLRPSALYYLNPEGGWVRRTAGDIRGRLVGEYTSVESESTAVFGAGDGDALSAILAVDVMAGENALLGAELRIGGGETDFSAGDAEWASIGGGFYGMARVFENFHINGAAGVDFFEFDEITRVVNLGPRTDSYAGDTDGLRFYLRGGLGYTFEFGSTSVTPEAAIAYDQIEIDGYTEAQGAASVAFGDNEITSTRAIVALALTSAPESLPGWSFGLRGGYEFELDDDRHEIAVGSNANGVGTLSLTRFDGSYGVISGRVGKAIGPGVLSLGGGATLPEEGETGFVGSVEFEMGF